ncbi:MAG: Ig-like domain-containing protein, partial [Lachnoclostridium sp.]|nr:Ig-like domain-containing protein [Lachnoclostridium sp.]
MYKRVVSILLILVLVLYPYREGAVKKKSNKNTAHFTIKKMSLYEGQKRKLKLKKASQKGKVKFTSSNKKIATVNRKGMVLAKKSGTVRIYAKFKKTGKRTSCIITVESYLKSISLLADTIILYQNQTAQIQASVLPKSKLKNPFTYRMINTQIASVSAAGVITAKTPGTTNVEIKSIQMTKQRKQLSRFVTVHVLSNPLPSESNPSIPSSGVIVSPPVYSDTPSVDPPTDAPTASPSVPPSGDPSFTLKERIAAIPSPPPTRLLADTIYVDDNGDESTLYFVNKAYSGGTVTIELNGKTTKSNESANDILQSLETDIASSSNKAGTIKVSRWGVDEWWRIMDIPLGKSYRLKAWKNDTVYGSPYGLIII